MVNNTRNYNSDILGGLNENGTIQPYEQDVSKEIVTISHEHHKIHESDLFLGGLYNNAVADNGVIEILLQTAVGYTPHIYIKLAAGGDAEFRIFEGTTFSAAGAALDVEDVNRITKNSPLLTATSGPTITADGNQLDGTEYLPGGSGGNAAGVQGAIGVEQFVLDANETYLLRLTNISGVTKPLNIKLAFYEIAV